VGGFLTQVTSRLAPEAPSFRVKRRGSLIQLYEADPGVHYEVWVQARRNRIELGLHFEGAQRQNERLLAAFGAHMLALRNEVSSDLELEQWTESWCRVHSYIEYPQLSSKLACEVAQRLLQLMRRAEPILEQARAKS
jgi:hypothetical protein